MFKKRLVWQVYLSFLLIVFVSLLAAGWHAARTMRQFHLERVEADLKARAYLLEESVRGKLRAGDFAAVDALCKSLGRRAATRLTVILPSGRVVGDSDEDVAGMEDHSRRPEVIHALREEEGVARRWSATLRRGMMYVALSLGEDGKPLAVVRTSLPMAHAEEELSAFYLRMALGGLGLAALVAILSLFLYRRIAAPLAEMRRGAERFAQGEFAVPVAVPESAEMGELANAMNQMARQLSDMLTKLVRQRDEQEAVLASMSEGVLAVDAQERVLTLNQAAARMTGVPAGPARGRAIQEVVRNPDLQKFVGQALKADEPVEGNVVSSEGRLERVLQARGRVLRDAQGTSLGAVIVLNDITRLRRLENMRRDFVANVSHELKTPITSIKGYVETLQDGAWRDAAEAQKFLEVVARHADRLDSIIGDLLRLAQIEQEAERGELEKEAVRIRDVLREAAAACAAKAAEKKIVPELDCADDLVLHANAPLLIQAVVNLVDNAVKYSETGGPVRIEAARQDDGVVIRVRDRGCGIPPEHVPRLGERFYRADKARSRSLGGTGLGLAIVKHIVEAHGGALDIHSELGWGSTFSISLPSGLAKPHSA